MLALTVALYFHAASARGRKWLDGVSSEQFKSLFRLAGGSGGVKHHHYCSRAVFAGADWGAALSS